MTSLFLGGVGGIVSCKVHPVVLFSVLDHYTRRDVSQVKVMGTLLGVTTPDGGIEIRNCFPVSHFEIEQVAVNTDFQRNMYELHKKANPEEIILGWYATGDTMDENSVLINDFYSQVIQRSPLHLLIDTSFTGNTINVGAYVLNTIAFVSPDKPVAAAFLPVKIDYTSFDFSKTGVDILLRSKDETSSAMLSELDSLERAVVRLKEMIDEVSIYVTKVIAGEVKPDPKIGRFLMDIVHTLPTFDEGTFERIFNNSMQDLLMVVYLSNLTRTQIALAEKLQSIV